MRYSVSGSTQCHCAGAFVASGTCFNGPYHLKECVNHGKSQSNDDLDSGYVTYDISTAIAI